MIIDEKIISTIGELLGAVVAGAIIYLIPKIKDWIEVHTTKTSQQTIELLVRSFVQAAEQLLHDNDQNGEKRMEYVKNSLNSLGIEITKEVVSIIEGAVWEVNNQNKKNIRIAEEGSEHGRSK